MMHITVLAENRADGPFRAEFGLSLLIRRGGERYLFDTGAGSALPANLERLGIAPAAMKKVILSHGHYDHTGGLPVLTPEDVWCAPGIADGHYSRHADGEVHDITMPADARCALSRMRVHWVEEFREISAGVYLTGPIPRLSGEDCGGSFFHDPECRTPDRVDEEQSLLISDGVLVSGCCHSGIVNTLSYCRREHPEIAVHSVVGGLHLAHADERRLRDTAEFLRDSGIERLFLLHCTGDVAVAYLKGALPNSDISTPAVGESFAV